METCKTVHTPSFAGKFAPLRFCTTGKHENDIQFQAELEQEKWTRKSTEELNTRLSRQNQQLRAKLQEKRDERAKLDEEIQAMKSKFKSKSKVQDENQQLVLSKCEETFEKLNRLHQDLDGIQKVRYCIHI